MARLPLSLEEITLTSIEYFSFIFIHSISVSSLHVHNRLPVTLKWDYRILGVADDQSGQTGRI